MVKNVAMMSNLDISDVDWLSIGCDEKIVRTDACTLICNHVTLRGQSLMSMVTKHGT